MVYATVADNKNNFTNIIQTDGFMKNKINYTARQISSAMSITVNKYTNIYKGGTVMGKITYRNPVAEDAERIVEFYNYVGGETSFLSFEKDEYPLGVKEQAEDIKGLEGNVNNTMLLALDREEIAGIATINSNHKIKSRHEGELGIVVAKKYQGQGIGSTLIQMLIDWCKGNGVTTRIRLDTRTDNTLAVSLYLKFGFIVEGCCKNQTFLNGRYYDLYIMGMMIK